MELYDLTEEELDNVESFGFTVYHAVYDMNDDLEIVTGRGEYHSEDQWVFGGVR